MATFSQTVDEIERLQRELDVDAARKALRLLLFQEAKAEPDGSTGAALALLAETKTEHRALAAAIVRFLAVPNLIPETNANNQIARSAVEIALGSLTDFCVFLGMLASFQTYENFATLKGAHERMCSLLSPLKREKSSLELFLTARHPIIQCLNHSAIDAYCSPFGLAEVINKVEHIFSIIRKVSTSDQFALNHQIKIFKDTIDEYDDLSKWRDNFLTRDFFLPFLRAAKLTVDDFVSETRGRFASPITAVLGQDNSIEKRYPLEEEREFTISIPLRNSGPGTAINVQAELEHDEEQIIFGSTIKSIGPIPPGDFSVAFDALVIKKCESISMILTISWEEMGSLDRKSLVHDVIVRSQKPDVPWQSLQSMHPYSTDVAKGSEFVGRREKVMALANKVLRTPMEPFYVTGQKRVGKTSLALAAAEFARTQSADIDYTYILWGGIAYENPRDSVRALGKEIVDLLERKLPGHSDPGRIEFEGSLAPALPLLRRAYEANPRRKYVLIIDEFDEIHPELYLQGNLAETFFANLRALATSENLCLVLIGGENMPFIMERQGQKLNKFVRFGLDYFSRSDEWEDFKLLVRKPTENHISWHDVAIAAIFNATNGNPYFAKTVCANVYAKSVRERDSDITADEVKKALLLEIPSLDVNSFAHLWQDGTSRVGSEREPHILQRCRVLVAIARTMRRGNPVTLDNIIINKHSAQLLPGDISAVLNDFMRREILIERDGRFEFTLPLFGLWLKDVGVIRLLSDTLAQELAEAAQAEEDRSYVQADEVSRLAKGWPTYRGREIGADDIRAWLQQVPTHKDQRLLFTIARNLRVFSEIEIREKLRMAFSFLRPKLKQFIIKKRSDRRTDVVVTYVDGEGKSGQYYASRFAEENRIPARSILSPAKFSPLLLDYVKRHESVDAIVIVDDIIVTGDSLSRKLREFVRDNEVVLKELKLPLLAISIIASDDGEEKVRAAMDEFEWLDFELRTCETLHDKLFAFRGVDSIWSNQDESERAYALCRDLGVNIYRDSPLGYGGQALLVVFPETCPNNTLPVVHSSARPDAPRKWSPLFPRITN